MKAIIIGVLAMAVTVVASNILVEYPLPGVLADWLTYGAFTYPVAFLVTDLMNRIYGAAEARKVVLVGFVTGIICSLIGSQVMLEFGPAVPLRIGVASGFAFLTAQLLDIAVFDRLRRGVWWKAPLASTVSSNGPSGSSPAGPCSSSSGAGRTGSAASAAPRPPRRRGSGP